MPKPVKAWKDTYSYFDSFGVQRTWPGWFILFDNNGWDVISLAKGLTPDQVFTGLTYSATSTRWVGNMASQIQKVQKRPPDWDAAWGSRGQPIGKGLTFDDVRPKGDPIQRCTCGAHATYGKDCNTHSDWCDL